MRSRDSVLDGFIYLSNLGGSAGLLLPPIEPTASSRDASPPRAPSLERSVLEAFCRRDPEALAAFFERYFDRVYALAYRMLGSHPAAEDASQEVFYRVQQSAHRFDISRDPGPWVVTLTLNVCRSALRSSQVRAARHSASAIEQSALNDPSDDPEEAWIAAREQHAVREAIAALPPMLREVVLLREYEEMDHSAIATALGLSHDAVRKRYSRALSALGIRLKGRLR